MPLPPRYGCRQPPRTQAEARRRGRELCRSGEDWCSCCDSFHVLAPRKSPARTELKWVPIGHWERYGNVLAREIQRA